MNKSKGTNDDYDKSRAELKKLSEAIDSAVMANKIFAQPKDSLKKKNQKSQRAKSPSKPQTAKPDSRKKSKSPPKAKKSTDKQRKRHQLADTMIAMAVQLKQLDLD